jgi:uncharacterized membrane protein
MTAAYAIGRSSVMTTIAGVAIAAALVPPLAVIGIALTHGSPHISLNACVLLITNLVAIILGAATIFRLLNVHGALHGSAIPVWVRRATILLFLSVALLIAPLLNQMIEGRRIGQNRPLEYPVSPQVREAVKQYISHWPEAEIITQGRISVEPEAGIFILLLSAKTLPHDFEQELINVVHKVRVDKPPVKIFPVLSASGQRPASNSDGE